MILCKNCQKPLKDSDKSCSFCGTIVQNSNGKSKNKTNFNVKTFIISLLSLTAVAIISVIILSNRQLIKYKLPFNKDKLQEEEIINQAESPAPVTSVPVTREAMAEENKLSGDPVTPLGNLLSETIEPDTTVNNPAAENNSDEFKIVEIGSQTWMAENLNSGRFNDGTEIKLVTDNNEWSRMTSPAYSWYDNDQATYGSSYGALYNWHAVKTGKLCPEGWHVPADIELTILTGYLEENVAGRKLKESGTNHWSYPNKGATNESGFTALPGGNRESDGTFWDVGRFGYLWSSTEYDSTNAWYRYLGSNFSNVYRGNKDKRNGYSVRCIKD